MRTSWKLGRVAGIDLFLHPTFLLVFLIFGGMGIPFILALFGCVLLHELGHALMARRFGIETIDITLYPIGGVARLERMPRAPGAELLIALAGPAVNFAIAGVLWWVCGSGIAPLFGPEASTWPGALLVSLLVANIVLGLFNLIPAFPMDGGRVLRALLSGWIGRGPATSVAATIGRALALAFGLYSLFTLNLIQVGLAAFIYYVAGAEESAVLAEERRRAGIDPSDQGIWTAPPGYRWVHKGQGVWQLAPIVVMAGGQARNPFPSGH